MKKTSFLHPMKKGESIFGWIYLPLHMFAIPLLLSLLSRDFFPSFGWNISSGMMNVIYYGIGFVAIMACMFHFIKASFHDLCDNKINSIIGIITGYFIYYVLGLGVSYLLSYLGISQINPNSQAINEQITLNSDIMTAVGVCLAPIVEEVLFRGVVFGNLRRKSKIIAYIVSTLLFAIYHLWESFLGGFSWELFLYTLQYVPGAIALAWCYERGRNIWAPIFLHMIINFLAININVSLR